MIGYVTLGTNDLPRAAKFYDELLAVIGAKRQMEYERGFTWGVSMDTPALGVVKPFDGKPATAGNGTMVALGVDTHDKVKGTSKNSLKPRWRRCKAAQNAHVLRVHCAFSRLCALPSSA